MEPQIDLQEHILQSGTQKERRLALDRVLNSKHFAHAPMKQKFLRIICEFQFSGRGGELNEYLIGREVFDRDDSYNPATDPIVRVGAHGVREKLALYYQQEGKDDEVQIDIPVGSYEPCFISHPRQTSKVSPLPINDPAPEIPSTTPPKKKIGRLWSSGAILLLTVISLVVAYFYFDLQPQNSQSLAHKDQDIYRTVWEPFLKSADQTLLVLSNPPLFRFINSGDPENVVKRSIPLTTSQADAIFKELPNKQIIDIIPNPRLTITLDAYTGMGEAIGIHRLTDLFRTSGKSVLLKQSRTASAEDLKNQNVIVLGSTWVNNWSGKLPAKEVFVYNNRVAIENHDPRQGEEGQYEPVFDEHTGNLKVDFALITVSPNISDENVVMVLAGAHSEGTAAAAEYVTGKHYLNELNRRLINIGADSKPPKYYQALLKVGVENGIPTTITLVSVHELRKRERETREK